MKYIIMCGCAPDNEHPKHFIVIDGEELIGRTIRLLKSEGVTDLALSTNNLRFEKYGLPLLMHKNDFYTGSGNWVDGFFPTDEPACYIMGDVFFSEAAIHTIVETKTDDVMFFASAPPFGKGYPKQYAEPFAFKVQDQEHFRKSINEVKRLNECRKWFREPISWELWQVIMNTQRNVIVYDNYTVINDYTCDIDRDDEIEQWNGGTKK